MDFSTALRRFAWLILAASQVGILYRLDQLSTPVQPALTPVLANSEFAVSDDAVSNDMAFAHLPSPNEHSLRASLQRIEQRLAGLERAVAGTAKPQPGKGAAAPTPYQPNASERAAADQRLSSLLPSGPLSREDVARFHASLQTLPPDERFAMATALARAINDGRVQPAPGGF